MGRRVLFEDEAALPLVRLLQGVAPGSNYSNSSSDGAELAMTTDTEVIRTTCRLYGTVFALAFALFLLARWALPSYYNLKKSYAHLRVPLADDPFGPLSWTWRVFGVRTEALAEQCGMDAASAVRLCEFGAKISLVACANALYLLPVYRGLGAEVEGDPAGECSLSNLPQGHPGMIATVVAAYVFFGAAMHFVDKDFEWLTEHRHRFLEKRQVQNYSVFLTNLPPDMQSDNAIQSYFRDCFGEGHVVDGDVALNIPRLEALASRRESLLLQLEHAINVRVFAGREPRHRKEWCGGRVESIAAYQRELEELNREISGTIDEIVADKESRRAVEDGACAGSVITESVQAIKGLIVQEETSARNAAFVTFADLVSANTALQVVHHHEPWDMKADSAPRPDLVNWNNVGINNQAKQVGKLISLALTSSLCVLWTIPVTFVSAFSSVDGLVKHFPSLGDYLSDHPGLYSVIRQLAPLILTVFISILPNILLLFCMFERPVEKVSMQHPSLFSKLSAFTIIQTFFITTLSGSLFQSLSRVIADPESALTLIAKALVRRSSFFIQLIIVQNLLALAIELLRIFPIVSEWLGTLVKKIAGYNLTEQEHNMSYLGLRDIADPQEYFFGRELGTKKILTMMVLFVYNGVAPITAFFTLAIFLLATMGLRNQFIYVYPVANDSGGSLWLKFTRTSVTCMIIAQIILCAILFLKKGFVSGALIIPLIVITILFQQYFNMRHYMVTNFLPLGDCKSIDKKNDEEGMTHEWLKDAYLQPAMKERLKYPTNYDKLNDNQSAGKLDPDKLYAPLIA